MKKPKRNKKKDSQTIKIVVRKQDKPNKKPIFSEKKDTSFRKRFIKFFKSYSPIIKVVAAIMTIIMGVIGFKSFWDNKASQIDLVYCDTDLKEYQIENESKVVELLQTFHRAVVLGPFNGISINQSILMPIIKNKSNNTIKNFKLEVHVELGGFTFSDEDINKDFVLIHKCPYGTSADFEYKDSDLFAFSKLSSPLNEVIIPDSVALSEVFYQMIFTYSLTYDKIKPKSITYSVILYVYINDFFNRDSNITINRFLDMVYKEGLLSDKETSLVSICDLIIPVIIIPRDKFKNITIESFEKFKSDIIDEYNEKNV